MAIRLKGILNTVAGATSESYLRIEFVKLMPWVGVVEYNPVLFRSQEEADAARIQYYGDELPQGFVVVPPIDLTLQSGSLDVSVSWDDLVSYPITGALQDVTINHYTESIVTQSIEATDFDEDGNEVTTTREVYWPEQTVYSQSIEQKNPIDLSRTTNIMEDCYEHFKGILATQIPAENILDL